MWKEDCYCRLKKICQKVFKLNSHFVFANFVFIFMSILVVYSQLCKSKIFRGNLHYFCDLERKAAWLHTSFYNYELALAHKTESGIWKTWPWGLFNKSVQSSFEIIKIKALYEISTIRKIVYHLNKFIWFCGLKMSSNYSF